MRAMPTDEKILNNLKDRPMEYRVKWIRIWNNQTQEEFAKTLGTKQATVSLWERGLRMPRARFLDKMIDIYQLPDDFFLDIKIKEIKDKRIKRIAY